MPAMDLFLRKVNHPQARAHYRVILKSEDGEFEIGSIGLQHFTSAEAGRVWGIDTAIPMRDYLSGGHGSDRSDCMRNFKTAWLKFAYDEASLAAFMNVRRRRR